MAEILPVITVVRLSCYSTRQVCTLVDKGVRGLRPLGEQLSSGF